MDFDLLPQMTIVFSIAGILFIVGKNFSKVKEASQGQIFSAESEKEKEEKEKFKYLYERATRRLNKENYRKKMGEFWLWLEKFLRKTRLMLMKLDGKMVAMLEHLRQKNAKTMEEWKKMAEAAEKNIQKSQGLFAGKGVLRNRKKADGETDQAGKVPDVTMQAAEGGVMLQEEQPAVGEDCQVRTGEEDAAYGYMPAEEAEEAESETYEEGEATAARRKEMENMIEKIDEFANEIEETEIFEETREGTGEGVLAAKEADEIPERAAQEEMTVEADEEALSDEEDLSENPEAENVRTRKEQECIELLMKDPADIKAYWKLGIIYSKRRNYEDALACFRQIVKIDPTYTKAKQKVIEVMEKMKKRGR